MSRTTRDPASDRRPGSSAPGSVLLPLRPDGHPGPTPNPIRPAGAAAVLSVLLAVSLVHALPPGPEERIVSADADANDRFGASVDVEGDLAVIGAPGDGEGGTAAGAAYVFLHLDGSWVQVEKLSAGDDAEAFDEFGWDVAIQGDRIVVGSPGDDDAGVEAGAAYLLEWDGGGGWTVTEKFLPDDAGSSADRFGEAVDIATWNPDDAGVEDVLTYIAIGAPHADAPLSFQGKIYLYRLNGGLWQFAAKFTDSDDVGATTTGQFGSSLAIGGDVLIGGAPEDDQTTGNAGAAYLWGRAQMTHGWTEVLAYYPTDATPGDRFGAAVDLSENIVAIGAPAPTNNGVSGRLFVYEGPGDPTILSRGAADDGFGSAVGLDEPSGTLVVGAPGDDGGGADSGAVWFFDRVALGDWQEAGRTIASDAGQDKAFGEAVALDVDTVVVGGSEADLLNVGTGAAYVYTGRLFHDGFEGGSTSAWSSSAP